MRPLRPLSDLKSAYPSSLIISQENCCRVFNMCTNQACEIREFHEAYTNAMTREDVLSSIMMGVENDWITLKNAASLCRAFGIYAPELLYLPDDDFRLVA